MGFWTRTFYILKDSLHWIWISFILGVVFWTLVTYPTGLFVDWIYYLSGLGIGLFLIILGFMNFRELRVVEDTPIEAIRSMAMGRVHIRGKATGAEPLTSFFTRTPCFLYWATIERYQRKDQADVWVTIHREGDSRWFYLDDGTGRVLVNPSGAEFNITKTLGVECELSRVRRAFVDPSLGIPLPLGEISKHLRGQLAPLKFTEYCLIAEREHNILGTCSQNAEPRDHRDLNLISKGEKGSTFLISSQKEKDLEKWFRHKSLALAAGGAGLMIATFAVILTNYGFFTKPVPAPPARPGPVEKITVSANGWTFPVNKSNRIKSLKLIYGPLPMYPPDAKSHFKEGFVKLDAIVGTDGTLKNVTELTNIMGVEFPHGDPLLVRSAIQTISRWRYEPILKNGKPVEAEIWFDVSFELNSPN
jgi:TonB family protein